MAYKYKQSYKDKQGKLRKTKHYYVSIDGPDGKKVRIPAYTDATASDGFLRRAQRLSDLKAAGRHPDAELLGWALSLDEKRLGKLVASGILDAEAADSAKSLSSHIHDFETHLIEKGNTRRHATQRATRAAEVLRVAGIAKFSEVTADKVSDALMQMRLERKLTSQTVNYYLAAAKHLCKWMVRRGRAASSPLQYMESFRTKGEEKRERRPLKPTEAQRLIEVVGAGRQRGCMPGAERALLYVVMLESGLRVSEMRRLTKGVFRLGEQPHIHLVGKLTKNRTSAIILLRTTTARALERHLKDIADDDQAFQMGTANAMTRAFAADLKDAGIPRQDTAGRVVDLHSLRHTFVTWAHDGGASIRELTDLARHSDARLTIGTYTHSDDDARRRIIDHLPVLLDSLPEAQARPAQSPTTTEDNKSADLQSVLQSMVGQAEKNREVLNAYKLLSDLRERSRVIPQIRLESTKPARGTESRAGHVWRWRGDSNPRVTDLQFLPQSQRTPSTEALSEGSQQRLASCLAEALDTYPDLERVFSAWTKLPELQQAGYRGAVCAGTPLT